MEGDQFCVESDKYAQSREDEINLNVLVKTSKAKKSMGCFGNIILVDTESPVHGIAGPTFQQGCALKNQFLHG